MLLMLNRRRLCFWYAKEEKGGGGWDWKEDRRAVNGPMSKYLATIVSLPKQWFVFDRGRGNQRFERQI
jgi:hypothetical protein